MADLPPELWDATAVASFLATAAILLAASLASASALPATTSPPLRFLFAWHLADALCHFLLEGGFLYHCFFSHVRRDAAAAAAAADLASLFPTPYNFLGWGAERIYGPQSGGDSPLAQLWMVYARADRRWAGVDLGVVSLELLTVFFAGPVACLVCYLIRKQSPKACFWMIVLATAELYGGFMTFCPEWLTGNLNLNGSNFMYMWVYLVFFNGLWVVVPLYAIWYSYGQICNAFAAQAARKDL
ncbi:uncharacterized protein UV8b_03082 [Ustilaginoidea virens]|uniref:EXPERA domain-containing protein n=1 Tax=Ustilaginoidea virens TaxID=1159556 RepID=A0A8E5MGG9_USTVR|nr:uncharacterized protein UV8b_03082 [Ustilaginoidea virens]QUC18841.1 hypothetical protein UV8b_03082 [Ustilaginoidea virens]